MTGDEDKRLHVTLFCGAIEGSVVSLQGAAQASGKKQPQSGLSRIPLPGALGEFAAEMAKSLLVTSGAQRMGETWEPRMGRFQRRVVFQKLPSRDLA